MENDRFDLLQQFSRGEISYRRLMDLLGIETDEALFLEMCKAGLPMPQLPEEETAAMVRLLGKICGGITMDSELWSLRNKLEDVLEACQAGDLTRAHMAVLELSMRLSHAEAAWKRLSAPVVVDSSPLPDLPPLPPPREIIIGGLRWTPTRVEPEEKE